MRRFGSVDGTTLNGMPYSPFPPKSGCSIVLPLLLMFATYCAEFARTGACEMSVFQALSAGKTGQAPTEGPARPPVGALGAVQAPAARTARTQVPARRARRLVNVNIRLPPCVSDRRAAARD